MTDVTADRRAAPERNGAYVGEAEGDGFVDELLRSVQAIDGRRK